MNLYDLHNKPHELDYHAKAQKIPQILIARVKHDLFSYRGINDKHVKELADKEHILVKDAKSAYYYYIAHPDLNGKRWPEAEEAFATDGWVSLEYARAIGKRFPAGEKEIAKQATYAISYANQVIKGTFPEGEKAIAQSTHALDYAVFLKRGRFPEGEEQIAKSAQHSIEYAKLSLHGRFKLGEPTIAKVPHLAAEYAIEIMGKRWTEAEPEILKKVGRTPSCTAYVKHFKIDV